MTQTFRHAQSSALPPAAPAGPALPRADQTAPAFGGYQFAAGEAPARTAGLFILTREIGGVLYPALIGEGEDIATAVAELRRLDALAAAQTDGLYWMARPNARQRAHIARELIGKFEPPLNVEHRKSRAAAAIAALIPDRAEAANAGLADHLAEDVIVSEAELRDLVRSFYARALHDPLIGPVFNHAVADWEHHFDIVQSFWSRTLLGTTRYKGNPFAPHVSLPLKPEFFDRWVEIFKATAGRSLQPAAAHRAIAKVEHMSACFQAGLFLPVSPERPSAQPVEETSTIPRSVG